MEEYIRLQQRNDEIWDLLENPDLPPLDRHTLNQEMLANSIQILIFEDQAHYEDDDLSTITEASSESIGPDDYDREGLIVYGNDYFDLADEI